MRGHGAFARRRARCDPGHGRCGGGSARWRDGRARLQGARSLQTAQSEMSGRNFATADRLEGRYHRARRHRLLAGMKIGGSRCCAPRVAGKDDAMRLTSRARDFPRGVRIGVLPRHALLLQGQATLNYPSKGRPLRFRGEHARAAIPTAGALHAGSQRVRSARPRRSPSSRPASQRRHPPHHALRHRHGEMHLLRALPEAARSMPSSKVRTEFAAETRGALLRQGAAARQWRPLGARDRQEHRARRTVPVIPR